ncbi:MAG: serine/threonine-protein kinase [Polyangiaceae bacterium]
MPSPEPLGRYTFFDEIAAGGMATVYVARQQGEAGFGRVVAAKRLHPALAKDPDAAEAFAREARHVSRIKHANVVPVLDVVRDRGELVMVLELVVGAPLSSLIRQARATGSGVPPNIAVAIIAGVLRGLHAAHEAVDEQGHPLALVHRDVSPQNVIVGVDGIARVLDFGIAKAAAQGNATRGQLKGKPGYMAPEQVQGTDVDARTDVFAAAVVAWELLTRQRLFAGSNDVAVARKILDKRIDAPSRVEPAVPKQLDAVVVRGLEREPSLRWATALEFAEALEQASTPASSSEVARWVSASCADEIASLVAAQARAEQEAHAAASALTPRENSTTNRRGWGLALGLAALLAAMVLVVRTRQHDDGAPAGASSLAPSASGLPVAVAPPALPSALPPPSAPASASAGPPPKATARGPRPVAPATSASAPARKVECDPPYVVDSEGFHRMKPACL